MPHVGQGIPIKYFIGHLISKIFIINKQKHMMTKILICPTIKGLNLYKRHDIIKV